MKVLYYIMILSLILLLNGNCAAVDAAAVASIWTSDNGSLCLGSASDTVLLSGVPVLAEINILKDLVIPKCIVDSPARLFKQISRLQQPVLNGTGSDRYFGAAVAISGTVVAVGAYAANSGSGAVYIFDTGCADVERQTLTISGQVGFGFAVAMSDVNLVVGAWQSKQYTGAAFVFEKNRVGLFVLEQELRPTGVAVQDRFGCSVAISGFVVAVGAYLDDTSRSNAGAVYVFAKTSQSSAYVQTQKLLGPVKYGRLGWSISLSGSTTLVASAHYYKTSSTTDQSLGSLYVFKRGLNGQFGPGAKHAQASFGSPLAARGTTIVANARQHDVQAVYILDLNPSGEYQIVQTLLPSNAAEEKQFGNSLAIDGTTVLVSSVSLLHNGTGTIYIYEKNTTGRYDLSQQLTGKFAHGTGSPGEDYGTHSRSIAISGSKVAVGALSSSLTNEAVNGSGSIFLFN